MLEIGLFHNGASSLPIVTGKDGVTFSDGSLNEVHRAAQETLVNQVRQGILAEKLGFQSFWLTEHHFQPEGAEMSPNPLMVQMAVAAHTKHIRLGQAANIIVWHHPVRLAEQIATLDVISGGRVECGVGRGYQPRENETLGRPYGSTIQDQERNRKAFEESLTILKKCWTEPSFSHHGEFFSVPPTYTKWNHRQTIAYFQSNKAERRLEDVLALGEPDMYSTGNPVQATTTTLKELQVFPQPVQKPHPQLWEPLTSARSLKFAAEHGINGVMIAEPNDRLRRNLEIYYEAAEKAGFPDMLNRGRFKFGWDAEKRRGIMTSRYLHITRPGREKAALDRAARGIELQFDYYGPFGFGAVVARLDEPMFDLNKRVTAEMLREREIAIHGSKQYVIDTIMKVREQCGYEDFCFLGWFELGGFEAKEIEEQMQIFAEEVMPALARECGGKVELPARGLDFTV
jgi:alkanesulfonate monooxygenase SsuD/methylene tetrahydromethanopterin reductase-like flavin-dependent oxidoreductase (luciferase family)